MMTQYLELSEDAMVERLQVLQKLARSVLKVAHKQPYDTNAHQKACTKMIVEMNKLAKEGDII